jgi:hypothetical protein
MNMPATTEQQQQSTALENVSMGFGSLQSFELMQRAAKLLSASTLVPTVFRNQIVKKGNSNNGWVETVEDNPNALPNCVIALNMSARMGADPLMIMQNLYVIEGRPSWSSQFVISAINTCGRYSPLRFDLSEAGEPQEVSYTASEGYGKERKNVTKKVTVRHQTCVAWAIERETGQRLESPKITIQMAIDEGWLTKNGSKWQTMPELMLRYRAAAFFGRLYSPEILMGLQTAEETHDVIDVNADGSVSVTRETAPAAKTVAMPQSKSASQAKAEPAEIVSAAEPAPEATQAAETVEKPAAKPKDAKPAANNDGEVLATDGEKALIKAKFENANMPVSQAIEICAVTNDFDSLTKSDAAKLLEFAGELAEG